MNGYTARFLALAVALSGTAPALGGWTMSCSGQLLQQRLDQNITPGEISGHLHTVSGGNAFGLNQTYKGAKKSECSSCPISQDNSNYWMPTLFFQAKNGSVIHVPMTDNGAGSGGISVTYGQPNAAEGSIQAYPAGLRMTAGNPLQRHHEDTVESRAINFQCLGTERSKPTSSLPKGKCPGGVKVTVRFPSCWDGINLDSLNHRSHVAYPQIGSGGSGPCPFSHSIAMMSLVYSVTYETQLFNDQWHGSRQPFVFAQGDATGYGMHGEFFSAWDVKTLQAAINDCNSDKDQLGSCRHFKITPNAECRKCTIPTAGTEVSGVLPRLPGCNAISYGPKDATLTRNGCSEAEPLGLPTNTKPSGYAAQPKPSGYGTKPEFSTVEKPSRKPYVKGPPKYQHAKPQTAANKLPVTSPYTDLTSSHGWRYLGCGKDSATARTFTAAHFTKSDMTTEKCISTCTSTGYTYAGLENGTTCYCGNTLATDRTPTTSSSAQPNTACTVPCAGNAKETCGGVLALSVYTKCGSGAVDDDGSCSNSQPALTYGAGDSWKSASKPNVVEGSSSSSRKGRGRGRNQGGAKVVPT